MAFFWTKKIHATQGKPATPEYKEAVVFIDLPVIEEPVPTPVEVEIPVVEEPVPAPVEVEIPVVEESVPAEEKVETDESVE